MRATPASRPLGGWWPRAPAAPHGGRGSCRCAAAAVAERSESPPRGGEIRISGRHSAAGRETSGWRPAPDGRHQAGRHQEQTWRGGGGEVAAPAAAATTGQQQQYQYKQQQQQQPQPQHQHQQHQPYDQQQQRPPNQQHQQQHQQPFSTLAPPQITAAVRNAPNVQALVARCAFNKDSMNPISISAALVAAVRLVEQGRWLPTDCPPPARRGAASADAQAAAADAFEQQGSPAEVVDEEAARRTAREKLDTTLSVLTWRLAEQRALCSGREIGNALWALSRLRRPPPPLHVLRPLLDQFADALPGSSCLSIAAALHALARMGVAPPPEWTDQVLYSFVAHAAGGRHTRPARGGGAGGPLPLAASGAAAEGAAAGGGAAAAAARDPWDCSPQAISNVIWALAAIDQPAVARVWAPALVRLLRSRPPNVPQVAANVLAGCARLGLGGCGAPLPGAGAGAGRGAPPAHAAARMHARAGASAGPPELFADLAWLLRASAPLLAAASPNELASTAWAAGRLRLPADPAWTAPFWAASAAALPRCAPGELAMLIHGVARCGPPPPAPPAAWVAAFLEAARRAMAAGAFAPVELTVVLWALGQMSIRPEPAWVEAALGALLADGGAPRLGLGPGRLSKAQEERVRRLAAGLSAYGDSSSSCSTPRSDGIGRQRRLPSALAALPAEDAAAAVSRAVKALGALRYRPATRALAVLLESAEALVPAMSPHGMIEVLMSLSHLGCRPPLPLLAASLERCKQAMAEICPADAVNLAYTLAKLQGQPRALRDWLRRRRQRQRLLLEVAQIGMAEERRALTELRSRLSAVRARLRAPAAAAAAVAAAEQAQQPAAERIIRQAGGQQGGGRLGVSGADAEEERALLAEASAVRERLRGLVRTWNLWQQREGLELLQLRRARARWRAQPGAVAAARMSAPELVDALFAHAGRCLDQLSARKLAHLLWAVPWLGYRPSPKWAAAAARRLRECAGEATLMDASLALWAAARAPQQLRLPQATVDALLDRTEALLTEAAAAAAAASTAAAAALPPQQRPGVGAPASSRVRAAAPAAAARRPSWPPPQAAATGGGAAAAPGVPSAGPSPEAAAACRWRLGPQDAVQLPWALAELGARPGPSWVAAFSAAARRLLPAMTGRQIGTMLRALAVMRLRVPEALLDAAETLALVNSASWEAPETALVSASVLQLRQARLAPPAPEEAAAAAVVPQRVPRKQSQQQRTAAAAASDEEGAGAAAAQTPPPSPRQQSGRRRGGEDAAAPAAAAAAAAQQQAEAEWELLVSLGFGPLPLGVAGEGPLLSGPRTLAARPDSRR